MHIARPCEAYVGASMYILLVMAPVVALCMISSNGSVHVIPVAVRGQGSLTLAGTGRVGVRTAAAGGMSLCGGAGALEAAGGSWKPRY